MCTTYLVNYLCTHTYPLDRPPRSTNETGTTTIAILSDHICASCATTFHSQESRRLTLSNLVRASNRPVKPMNFLDLLVFYAKNGSPEQAALYSQWRATRMFIRNLGKQGWKGYGEEAWNAIGDSGGVREVAIDRSIWGFANIHRHKEWDSEWPCAIIGHPRDSAWPVEGKGWGFEDGRGEQEVVGWVLFERLERWGRKG